jgi:hypothetical protein
MTIQDGGRGINILAYADFGDQPAIIRRKAVDPPTLIAKYYSAFHYR